MQLINPPDGRPWALFALCGASLLLNVVLVAKLSMAPAVPDAPVAPDAPPVVEAVAQVATDGAEVAPDAVDQPEEVPAPAGIDGVHIVRADVSHSLARTFQTAVPEHADVVSAVYARLFVWDLDLRRDLQKGDEIVAAYDWDGELAHIPVASYRSGKLGKTLNAYQFHREGDAFPSWWDETGVEVPRRLVDGPLREYEQVTSLLKDRPTHKGMDFKVPVGTEVITPKAATVVRADWNLAYNGNCVEVRYTDGTLARFLHLSDTQVRAGQQLAAGAVVGLSGNTGRSTAPHLHYELEKGGKVVDPVRYHGVTRRTLSDSQQGAFDAQVARLKATISTDA
jgi:murein DD-endopeptidase MepM/ murein hydrolase activator NlpD